MINFNLKRSIKKFSLINEIIIFNTLSNSFSFLNKKIDLVPEIEGENNLSFDVDTLIKIKFLGNVFTYKVLYAKNSNIFLCFKSEITGEAA